MKNNIEKVHTNLDNLIGRMVRIFYQNERFWVRVPVEVVKKTYFFVFSFYFVKLTLELKVDELVCLLSSLLYTNIIYKLNKHLQHKIGVIATKLKRHLNQIVSIAGYEFLISWIVASTV